MSEGRLVLWGILNVSELDRLEGEPGTLTGVPANAMVVLWIVTIVLIGGGMLARSNFRRGRVDRRGAWRLGIFALVIPLAGGILGSHALSTKYAVAQLYPLVGTALFYAAVLMLLYIGVEPYARRIWPSMLVSWSRLLGRTSRNWRDPLIGRSVLGGLFAGTLILFLVYLSHVTLAAVQGGPFKPLIGGSWSVLLGQRYVLAEIFGVAMQSIGQALSLTFMLVVAKLLLRRTWLAVLVAGVGYMFTAGLIQDTFKETIVYGTLVAFIAVIHIAVLLRFGLVGLLVAAYLNNIEYMTRTTEWTAWHSQPAIMALIVIAVLSAYGFWAATAGKKFALESLPGEN